MSLSLTDGPGPHRRFRARGNVKRRPEWDHDGSRRHTALEKGLENFLHDRYGGNYLAFASAVLEVLAVMPKRLRLEGRG